MRCYLIQLHGRSRVVMSGVTVTNMLMVIILFYSFILNFGVFVMQSFISF